MKYTVLRIDRGELQKPVEMPNGWLKVDAFIGRTGILEYKRADGSVWREYRPPEEAFDAEALASFDSVPLTNNHPPSGRLDASNTREYQVGTVGKPVQAGEMMRSSILITDENMIASAKAGKVELSSGYMAEVEITPGEINGQRYDAIQRKVRGNHVAAVDAGRAGPSVCMRVDSLTVDLVQSDSHQIGTADARSKGNLSNMKITIRSVEYEVSEQVAQAITSERTDHRQALDGAHAETKAARTDAEKASARADGAESQVKKLADELKTAPSKALETMKFRAQLETDAAKHLGASEKFDGKTDGEIKRAVAEKVMGIKLDGKTDVYVDAMFDVAIKREPSVDREPITAPLHGASAHTDEGDADAKARADYQKTLTAHFAQ